MKRCLIFLILISSVWSRLQAQTSYSCTYKQICSWNALIEQYDNCIGGAENASFEVNKAESILIQTIQNSTTSFPIKSKERKKKNRSIYLIMNAAGDKFYYICDSRNNEVRILSKQDGKASLVIYSQGDPMLSKE